MLKTDNTMEELLSLKWNNHRSTFLHILAVLRDKQLYTDATLACDGKLYSVHKLVLSTCSDYFSSMLDRTSCKSPVIVLKDIKCEDLEALLDYMYLGEVNVRQSDLATLIKAAECLRVKGLAVPDDEPPPRKARENQTRRGDTSGSPPAKRKRRSDVDDGRDDVRPPRQEVRQSSPVHSSSSVRPKSPVINSHSSPSPIRSNSTSNINNSNNPSNSNTLAGVSSNNSVTPRQVKDGTGDEYMESAPYVKVEMDDETGDGGNTGDGGGGGGDSSTGDIGDAYNLSNDDFKEEDDPDGSDMNADLPEFLQQATANYPHTSFAGPSFQPDLSWQGGSNGGEGGSGGAAGLAGSFAAAAAAGLSFGGSSQQDAAGHNTSAGTSKAPEHSRHHSHRHHPHLSGYQEQQRSTTYNSKPSSAAAAALMHSTSSKSVTFGSSRHLKQRGYDDNSSIHLDNPFNSSHNLYSSNEELSSQLQLSYNSSLSSSSTSSYHHSNTSDGAMIMMGGGGGTGGVASDRSALVFCPVCHKSFRGNYGKYNLKKHFLIHQGDKPFKCPRCEYGTIQKAHLKRHLEAIHSTTYEEAFAGGALLRGSSEYHNHEQQQEIVGSIDSHDEMNIDNNTERFSGNGGSATASRSISERDSIGARVSHHTNDGYSVVDDETVAVQALVSTQCNDSKEEFGGITGVRENL